MNVRELLEELGIDPDGGIDAFGNCLVLDAEVRLAHQPSWPFELSIQQVLVIDENEVDEEDQVALAEALHDANTGDKIR